MIFIIHLTSSFCFLNCRSQLLSELTVVIIVPNHWDTTLSSLHPLSHLTLPAALGGRNDFFPHLEVERLWFRELQNLPISSLTKSVTPGIVAWGQLDRTQWKELTEKASKKIFSCFPLQEVRVQNSTRLEELSKHLEMSIETPLGCISGDKTISQIYPKTNGKTQTEFP